MTYSLTISRTSLSLADLVVPSTGYEMGEGTFGPGGVTWNLGYAGSRFVDGDALVDARKANSNLAGVLRVVADEGSDPTVLQSREAVLVTALSQFAYTVTFTQTVGATSVTYSWSCQPANVSPSGGAFLDYHRNMLIQEFDVTIPRSAVPVSGPI